LGHRIRRHRRVDWNPQQLDRHGQHRNGFLHHFSVLPPDRLAVAVDAEVSFLSAGGPGGARIGGCVQACALAAEEFCMKRLLLATLAVVGVSNLYVFFHAQANRLGQPDAELDLDARELALNSASQDEGWVTLQLLWNNPTIEYGYPSPVPPA